MMESMVVPFGVFFLSKWFYTKRVPVMPLGVVASVFLFLSPVKGEMRDSIVQGRFSGVEQTSSERGTEWLSRAVKFWDGAVRGDRSFIETTSTASSRTDLIHTFAYIYLLTPTVGPYQYGETYKYLAITLIPRLFWPEKPQANAANSYFAVVYEVSNEEGIKSSNFGVTLMGEGYINFGVFGVALIMIFFGLFTSVLEEVFAGKHSGPGGRAIFLATSIYFLNGLGNSAELAFGGVVQVSLASC